MQLHKDKLLFLTQCCDELADTSRGGSKTSGVVTM